MKDSMIIEGKEYISSRRASEMTKYSNDYVGQLCRMKKVSCTKVGRVWFIDKESLLNHKKDADAIIHSGPYILQSATKKQPTAEAETFSVAPKLPTTKYSSPNLMTYSDSELASFPISVPDLNWKISETVLVPSDRINSSVCDSHDAIQNIRNRTKNIHPVFHHVKPLGTIILALLFVGVGTFTMAHPERVFGVVREVAYGLNESLSSFAQDLSLSFAQVTGPTLSASVADSVDPLAGNILDSTRVSIVSAVLDFISSDR